MAKTPLIATGLNGLVGSKFQDDFADKYEFLNLDLRDPTNPVDITNYDQVLRVLSKNTADFVFHLAAYTDVTGAWQQKDDKSGIAYQVNVVGTENIVKACQATKKHLIHVSTAYVFDGENEGMYKEDDKTNPIEWYGQTKAWAEEIVMGADLDWTILRIDQPFRSDPFPKVDIAHRIIAGLKAGNLYPQFDNHFFGPTFIDEFAKVVDWVIKTGTTGLFNASSGEKWSDYEFAKMINEVLEIGGEVKRGDLDDYLKTLDRPYQRNTAMDCGKLKSAVDWEWMSVEKSLNKIKL